MKVIRKEIRNIYCGSTKVGYDEIFIINQLPKEEEYIEVGNHKGYVVSISYSEEDRYYTIYLEKNLGDWNNQNIDICDAFNVDLERGE